jgi:magnesium transporter
MKKKRSTYTNKIGLPPGSLVYIGRERKQKVTISEINFSPNQYEEVVLQNISDCYSWDHPDTVTLINVIGIHDTAVIEAVGKHFSLDQMILEDIVNSQSRSKLEEFDDFDLLRMNILGVDINSNEITAERISLLLAKNGVISFQENEIDFLTPLKERIRKNKGTVRQRKSDFIFYRLIDTIVDNYFLVIEHLTDRIDELEEKILHDPDVGVHEEIYDLKRKIGFVKRTISPIRESISNIIKSDGDLVSESTQNYFRDVYDHLLNLIETVDSQKETINDFLNLYMSAMSNKMNEVMKVLTIFASIFIPLTFIAGIYGMNFEIMPELQWRYGYFIAWGVMLLVTILLLIYFKRKKWL